MLLQQGLKTSKTINSKGKGVLMNNFQEDIIPPHHDHITAEYYCCYLCGHELVFSYRIDEHRHKITEQSAFAS